MNYCEMCYVKGAYSVLHISRLVKGITRYTYTQMPRAESIKLYPDNDMIRIMVVSIQTAIII